MHEPSFANLFAHLEIFMRRNGLVEQTILEHQPGQPGWCTCSTTNVKRPWPCTAHLVAARVAGQRVR